MLREAVAARGAKPSMVTFATIQDAGEPIDELTFDCAFTLRLKPTPLSVLPQLSSASPAARALPPVSLSALRARFAPTGEIPAEISERLAALRRSLDVYKRQVLHPSGGFGAGGVRATIG